MTYERLNLVNGDRFTASHIEHIDNALEYITQYCDEFDGYGEALLTFINLIGGYEVNILRIDPNSGTVTQVLSSTQLGDQDAELRFKKWAVYEPQHQIGSLYMPSGYKILQPLAFMEEEGLYIFSTVDQSQIFMYNMEDDIWTTTFWNYNFGVVSVDENNKFYAKTNYDKINSYFQLLGSMFFGSSPKYTITRVKGTLVDVGQCIGMSNTLIDGGVEIPYLTFEFPADKSTFKIYHYDGEWITEEEFSHIPQ